MLRTWLLTIFLMLISVPVLSFNAVAQNPSSHNLTSPNGHIQLNIQTGERLTYDVLVNGKPVASKSTLSIDIDHTTLGLNPRVTASKPGSVDREISCPVPHKAAKLRET